MVAFPAWSNRQISAKKKVAFIRINPLCWPRCLHTPLSALGTRPCLGWWLSSVLPGPGPASRLPFALFVLRARFSDLPPRSQLTCLCFFPSAKSALLPSFRSGAALLPALFTAVQVSRNSWTNNKTLPALVTWVLQPEHSTQKLKQQLRWWGLAPNPHKSKVIWKQLTAFS